MACEAHANHPARLRALRAGKKRFTGPPCVANSTHVLRFVSTGKCAECSDEKNSEAKIKAARVVVEKTKIKPPVKGGHWTSQAHARPMIGADLDADVTRDKLVKTTETFLRFLYAEKLTAIRSRSVPQ
jgi:hypothetical protein